MPSPDPNHQAVDDHLTTLAGQLTEADVGEDLAAVSALAWQLLTELTVAEFDSSTLRRQLGQLRTAAQATLAAHGEGAADPLAHLRHVLAASGQLPWPGERSCQILAGSSASAAAGHRIPSLLLSLGGHGSGAREVHRG